jgi:uncharacterized membrane protein
MIRLILRWVLAAFYAFAGVIHLIKPAPFLGIMPGWVPAPEAVVLHPGPINRGMDALATSRQYDPARRCGSSPQTTLSV